MAMFGFSDFNQAFGSVALTYMLLAGLVLVVLMPARILQRRHGYPAWILVFGLIPYVGPLLLLWALAISSPRQTLEVSA